MQDFLTANLSPKHLQVLNNCRLFLQVTMLAEISDHNSTKLLNTNLTTSTHTPNLSRKSISLLKWPHQPNLGRSAWKIRTKTLQQLYTKPGLTTQLQQPLGPWNPQCSNYLNVVYPLSTQIPKQSPRLSQVRHQPFLHWKNHSIPYLLPELVTIITNTAQQLPSHHRNSKTWLLSGPPSVPNPNPPKPRATKHASNTSDAHTNPAPQICPQIMEYKHPQPYYYSNNNGQTHPTKSRMHYNCQ